MPCSAGIGSARRRMIAKFPRWRDSWSGGAFAAVGGAKLLGWRETAWVARNLLGWREMLRHPTHFRATQVGTAPPERYCAASATMARCSFQ